MRRVRERSPWLQLAVVFGGFVIGPYVALQVGRQLTPESELVQSLSVFAFALVFVGGTLLWTALGLGYGWLLWAAAHHGYLPFLAPE